MRGCLPPSLVLAAQEVPSEPSSGKEGATGTLDSAARGNAESPSRSDSSSQQSVPVYAGTLFGDLPKSPESMFGSTTFTDGDEDKVNGTSEPRFEC